MIKKILNNFWTIIFIASVLLNITLIVNYDTHRGMTFTDLEDSVELSFKDDTLSNWDMFTLALMKVESEYDSTAVSSVGAKGYLQITPIYVKEVNRIYNTNYRFEQVTNFETSYEIFDLMQQAHNPNYNMDKALELHNGKHKWYNRRVYNAMKEIKKYEEMRNKMLNKEI